MASAAALQTIANSLNERQRVYLLAAYAEDQRREAVMRGPGARSAAEWRWIKYGPVGAKELDAGAHGFLLRRELQSRGMVSQGTGAAWAALERRGLLTTQHAFTGFVDARTGRRIMSLLVRLTTDGRKAARVLRGDPVTRPRAAAPLSLSALRLVAYGQAHPDKRFSYHEPWGMCPLDYLVVLGICRGLVKRGLLVGDPPHDLKITSAGLAFDVTKEPNWKPAPPTRPSLGSLMDL